MVHVVLNPPLPKLMGIVENSKGMTLEVPFSPGANLSTFFAELAKKYPGFGELIDSSPKRRLKWVSISVNGKILAPGKWSKVLLSDGDEMTLMLPYMGG